VVKRFYGSGVQVVGGANVGSYYYERDHLGSIRNVLDASGNVAIAYDYDLWGRRTKLGGAFDVDFGYAGYFEHASSGLALTKYRGYAPLLGRWLSRDPSGMSGGINSNIYVSNSPIEFKDPLGLWKDGRQWDQPANDAELKKYVSWMKDFAVRKISEWKDADSAQNGAYEEWEDTPEKRQEQIREAITADRPLDEKVIKMATELVVGELLAGTYLLKILAAYDWVQVAKDQAEYEKRRACERDQRRGNK
jgi:RHS repeat-associated protein